MSHRRKPQVSPKHERWLVSYADFITLLFAFFVVLYSTSQVDRTRMTRLAAAIEGAFHGIEPQGAGIVPASDLDTKLRINSNNQDLAEDVTLIKQELELALAAEIDRREVALRVGPEGLIVSLREIGFFNSGSDTLKPGSEATVSRIAVLLREHDVALRVEGHTDNVPIHTAEFTSNWELSTARATQMIKVLITSHGFSPDRLSAAGYGEFHPIASNATEDGRRQNRRLDMVVLVSSLPEQQKALAKTGHHLGALGQVIR